MKKTGNNIFSRIFNRIKNQEESNERFVTEKDFRKNLKSQLEMNKLTLSKLRKYNIDESSHCKIEYFFYTNKMSQAKSLCSLLSTMEYACNYGKAAGYRKLFVITGWTNKINMSGTSIDTWTEHMCQIGYDYDCEFDGWGTNDF